MERKAQLRKTCLIEKEGQKNRVVSIDETKDKMEQEKV